MADGTVIRFPESDRSDEWTQFWEESSQLGTQLFEEGNEDSQIIAALGARLTEQLTSEDEINIAALISGSTHESPFVRAAIAGKIEHVCRFNFEQGELLARTLTLDPAHLVRASAYTSIEAYLIQTQADAAMALKHRDLLAIFTSSAIKTSEEYELSTVARHPSGGNEPNGAA